MRTVFLYILLLVSAFQGAGANGPLRSFSSSSPLPPPHRLRAGSVRQQTPLLASAQQDHSAAAVSAAGRAGADRPVLFPALAASFATAAVLYPLELLNALKMAGVSDSGGGVLSTRDLIARFVSSHGMKGLFLQGLVPHVARSTLMNFVAFALFPPLHQLLFRRHADFGNGFTRAVVGSIVTIPEVLSIMPLEISKLALQLDDAHRYGNSMLTALRALHAQYGLRLFGVGYYGTQYKHAAWTGLYFATLPYFERLSRYVLSPLRQGQGFLPAVLEGLVSILGGFLAGAIGALANRPGDTLRTIIQKRCFASPDLVGGGGLRGNWEVLKEVLDGPLGWRGLYAGIGIKTVSMGAAGALMALFIPFFESFYSRYLARAAADPHTAGTGADSADDKRSSE